MAAVIDGRALARDVARVMADHFEATVDYRSIARLVEELAEQRIAPIETFAHRLPSQCLEFSGVCAAEITIDKPQALSGGLASVTMRISDDSDQMAIRAPERRTIEEEV